jgi:hypothetical protein
MRTETERDGDPICDRFGYCLFDSRSITVMADGCNWGERPKQAAVQARNTVLQFLKQVQHEIFTLEDALTFMLLAIGEAQHSVCTPAPGGVSIIILIYFSFTQSTLRGISIILVSFDEIFHYFIIASLFL